MAEEITNIPSSEFDSEDMIPVSITFFYHDFEGNDGEESEVFWISKEDYIKIENYYVKPYAHYIGAMINFDMPQIKTMVEERACHYATNIFISKIECDEDLLSCCWEIDNKQELDDYANSLIDNYIKSNMDRDEQLKIVRGYIDTIIEHLAPKTDKYAYIDEELLFSFIATDLNSNSIASEIQDDNIL